LHNPSSEFATLSTGFERASAGSVEVGFIKGETGTGKTSLPMEQSKFVVQRVGHIIKRKYDQSQEGEQLFLYSIYTETNNSS